jgi:hypothetical protein
MGRLNRINFKSEKGSPGDLVHEVIMCGLVITLLAFVVIPLFSNSQKTIKNISNKSNDLNNFKEVGIVPLGADEVDGGDVIAVIRYYSNNPDVTVYVDTSLNGDHTYVTETYDSGVFTIDREAVFDAVYIYNGKLIERVNYIEQ